MANKFKVNLLSLSGQNLTANSQSLYLNNQPIGIGSSSAGISGSGTINFIPRFNSNSGIENSNITNIGSFIGINVTNPTNELEISGDIFIKNNSSNAMIIASGNFNDYQEINIQNWSNGQNASSDLVITNNIGTASTNYVNLGINSSTYTGKYVGYSGDGYLYGNANDFYIGNAISNKKIYFFVNNPITGLNGALMTLDNNQVRVSGDIFASGGKVLTALDSGNLSAIRITGSNIINVANLTGVGLTNVSYNNGLVYISGIASSTSTSAGVTGISVTGGASLTGLVQYTGVGGLSIIQSANTILFSGGGGGSVTNNYYTTTGGLRGAGSQYYIPVFDNNGDLKNSTLLTDPSSYNLLSITGNVLGYQQLNVQNLSTGADSSSDIVVTQNNGTETTGYVNLGINSSNYTGGYVGTSGDAYLYVQGNDLYLGTTNASKSVMIFAGVVPNAEHQAELIINPDSLTLYTPNLNLLKTTTPAVSESSSHSNLYMDNLAERSILSYANSRGIGKAVQNTFALETIHNFAPNTTTTMSILGTTATSAGTLSHPTAFADITGCGFCTNFAGLGPLGIQSATTGFYLTSGITGLGAGFFYASQFQFFDRSGIYPPASGFGTGINFFAGMTNAATVILSTAVPYNTAATLGFQFVRQSGISGRSDNTIKFVSKDNGAAAPFHIQDTDCPFVAKENYSAYIYGRNDFRNGVHWMIKRLDRGLIYSGNFTGAYSNLPLVSASSQIFLKPSIGVNIIVSGTASNRNFRLRGLYCETV